MNSSGMWDPQLWRSSPGISLCRRAQFPCPVPITLLLPSSTQLAGVFPRPWQEASSKTRRHVCWSMPLVWASSCQPNVWGECWIDSWCCYMHRHPLAWVCWVTTLPQAAKAWESSRFPSTDPWGCWLLLRDPCAPLNLLMAFLRSQHQCKAQVGLLSLSQPTMAWLQKENRKSPEKATCLPHAVKRGSYEAVEIPPLKKKKKTKGNEGLDQGQAFEVCSESPRDSCMFNTPLFLSCAQVLFFLTASWIASDLISTTFLMHMLSYHLSILSFNIEWNDDRFYGVVSAL